MKKIFCLVFIAVLLCGCSQNAEKTALPSSFSFTAAVTVKNKKFKLNGNMDAENKISATVVSPKTIEGSFIEVKGDAVNISFMGITSSKNIKDIPGASFIPLLYDAMQNSGKATKKSITGKSGGYEYTLQLSDDGLPQKLTVPKIKTEIEFSNIIVKDR